MRMDCKKDINTAELSAIYTGLLLCPFYNNIEVLSDSITALQLIGGSLKIKKYQLLVDCIRYVSASKFGKNVQYTKVKGHSGDHGNTVADILARTGTTSDIVFFSPTDCHTTISEIVHNNIYKNMFIHDIVFPYIE